MNAPATQELVRVEGLTKHFQVGSGFLGATRQVLKAVEQVSLSVTAG